MTICRDGKAHCYNQQSKIFIAEIYNILQVDKCSERKSVDAEAEPWQSLFKGVILTSVKFSRREFAE